MNRKSFIALLLIISSAISVSGQSTVYFYRLKNMVMSNTAIGFTINDTSRFFLANGDYYKMVTDSKKLKINTSITNIGLNTLDLQPGKTYYIDLKIKNLSTINLVQEDDYSGKPAIERLDADKKAKELTSANLPTIKVLETDPLPKPSGNEIKIYLYRPFDAVGAFKYVKITDGEKMYDMKNNTAHTITTKADQITFQSIQEGSGTSNTTLNLKLEIGKVYYVCVVRSGGAIVLSETKEDYAKQQMKL